MRNKAKLTHMFLHMFLIAGILDAIRQLMAPPEVAKKQPIGFVTTDAKPGKSDKASLK
jgi:hypothetical protein